ncbi:hypothetical protein OH802_28690 [Nocardioides sp. NBC_00850]|uniref:hypothetical protein n=1 Tax=Nocardioides sp. NBC_00850 TaxID=2976001 RepID=UPI0038662EC5|nr:hypothetical protein OH802_28690 [Nocardioides sp. NBC_00850]
MELLEKVTAVRAGAAAAMLLVATAVLTVAGVGFSACLVTMVALSTGAALMLTVPYALLLALTGWGLVTGFAVNTGGQLTFAASDLRHLALLLALGAAASLYSPGSRV